jgi:hypothetical protein
LKEPRTAKSFRDAADRIVRQESALPPSISRLLGAPALPARRATTDAEAWDVRLAALATLGQFDGLTYVTLGAADASPAYNLVHDLASEPAIRDAVHEAVRSAATAQLRAGVPLADGRVASAVLVSPLAPSEAFAGALVALRAGRPFAAADAYTAVGVAEIVSLELARSIAAGREATERRQALTLYELARYALFDDDLDDVLQSIAMLLASTLDHDASQIWLRRPDGALRRHAAFPPDPSVSEIAWEDDHSALLGALRERRVVRLPGPTNAAWAPSNTRHLLVVPLRADPRPRGILVLGRVDAPYGLDDIEFGDVLGLFIGRVVSSGTRRGGMSTRADDARVRSAPDDERDAELAESHRPT